MAVYYKWIKGCEPNSTLKTGAWSYISWGSTTDITKTEAMPKLRISTGKNDDDDGITGNLGYFLTNNMPTPDIMNKWVFKNSLEVGNTSTASYFHGSFDFDGDVNFSKDSAVSFNNRIYLYDVEDGEKNNESSIYLSGDNELKAGGSFIVEDYLKTHGDLIVGTDKNPANIITYGYCQANYFNATSDRRAKENIQPADFSALDIINKLQVYTFNYKNNPNTVPGLIAQDLLEAELPLELVNNKNASGEKDDYMNIRESKLIYILWKAIQEQQAEIIELKKQLKI